MSNAENIVKKIQKHLKEAAPELSEDKKKRMYAIINSYDPDIVQYGLKMKEIENVVKQVHNEHKETCDYECATNVFRILIQSHVHEEKFASVHFLNRYKRYFNETTPDLFLEQLSKYCDSWSICDSSMIRVLGPFLGKKKNKNLFEKTIEKWSQSEYMWIRRASMVLFLKRAMIQKDFENDSLFGLVDNMFPTLDEGDYIARGIGWMLKQCSKYKPDLIFRYLMENRGKFSRMILRYATEKLTKEKRNLILQK